jgi:hypothetical protein
MTRYEYKSGGKKGRNRYAGSWTETVSKNIDLPFTVESMRKILEWGASPDNSPVTHQDIAHWCDRFHMVMLDADTDKSMDAVTGIAAAVDAQWDMYLASTYTLEELQNLDFSTARIPVEWFHGWLNQLGAA